MKTILYASLTFLCLGFVHSAENYDALIFHREDKTLIKLPREISNDDAKSEKWATACPAASDKDAEGIYNTTKSFSKNALFVKQFYNKETLSNIKKKLEICNKPYKLSVAANIQQTPIFYEFGFDIHFKTIHSKNFITSDRDNYKSIADTLKMATRLEYLEKHPKLVKASKKKKKTTGFVWIPLFKLISTKKQLRRIEYEIHRDNRNSMAKCQDYSLGKELFEDIKMEGFYSTEAQKTAFRSINIPAEASKECQTAFDCFEKALLIPADQFRFSSTIIPRCSNMATIPIWTSAVKDILQKVDKFLYALSQVSGRPLRITAGVHENLHYRTRRTNLLKYILLKSQKSNLHVPKIIYKIVKLKLIDGCKKEDPACWSGIIIIIHNYPNFDPEDPKDRICEDESEKLGWEEITYPELSTTKPRLANIYICSIGKNTLANIGLEYDEKLSIGELSLKNFPFKNDKIDKDMKTQVFDELKRLAEGGKIMMVDSLIKRPFLDDDEFILQQAEITDVSKEIEEQENTIDNETEQEKPEEKVANDDNKPQKEQKDHEIENRKEEEDKVSDDGKKAQNEQTDHEIENRKEEEENEEQKKDLNGDFEITGKTEEQKGEKTKDAEGEANQEK